MRMALNKGKEQKVVHADAEKKALQEEKFREDVEELWAQMYGKYRAETEKHWMQYDRITEQIHRHEEYLERLSSRGLNKKTEERYRRLVSQNLRVIKGVQSSKNWCAEGE